MNRWHALEGAPSPFGATWIEAEQAYNFAIYSKHASSVVLLLYSENDVVNPVYSYRMVYPANKTGRIWLPTVWVPSEKDQRRGTLRIKF
jgi:isoamylase